MKKKKKKHGPPTPPHSPKTEKKRVREKVLFLKKKFINELKFKIKKKNIFY